LPSFAGNDNSHLEEYIIDAVVDKHFTYISEGVGIGGSSSSDDLDSLRLKMKAKKGGSGVGLWLSSRAASLLGGGGMMGDDETAIGDWRGGILNAWQLVGPAVGLGLSFWIKNELTKRMR
jgi:hypothetical protein